MNSVHTQPAQENSEKSRVKIQKTKKPLSGIFLAKTGWDRPRKTKKKKKNLVSNSVHTRPEQENSQKNSKKIQKIKKPLSHSIFS